MKHFKSKFDEAFNIVSSKGRTVRGINDNDGIAAALLVLADAVNNATDVTVDFKPNSEIKVHPTKSFIS